MNIEGPILITKDDVDKKVWVKYVGWGIIQNIREDGTHPVVVRSTRYLHYFTVDGMGFCGNRHLYWEEQEK